MHHFIQIELLKLILCEHGLTTAKHKEGLLFAFNIHNSLYYLFSFSPADKDGTKNNVNMTYWLVPLVISIVGAAIGFAYIMSTKRTTSPRGNIISINFIVY